jgi:nicotinamide mononucleotide transporter
MNLSLLEYIEYLGVFFGFVCVVLAAIENPWCWPTGIISVIAYFYFYYEKTWYASMWLQLFFLITCIVGWYQWLYGGENKTALKTSHVPKKYYLPLVVITFVAFLLIGLFFDQSSDDSIPYMDALVTAMSVSAQIMMNMKYIESWIVWIMLDIIYAVLHFKNGHYPSFFLYASYVVTASIGYYSWRKSYYKQVHANAESGTIRP